MKALIATRQGLELLVDDYDKKRIEYIVRIRGTWVFRSKTLQEAQNYIANLR